MSLRVEAGFEHLREAMAEILPRVVEFPPGVFVTVLAAKVTANTAHARITLSVFPETKQEEALKALAEASHEIKEELADRLRLRRMPNIHYVFDENEAYAADIDRAIHDLKEKGEL